MRLHLYLTKAIINARGQNVARLQRSHTKIFEQITHKVSNVLPTLIVLPKLPPDYFFGKSSKKTAADALCVERKSRHLCEIRRSLQFSMNFSHC